MTHEPRAANVTAETDVVGTSSCLYETKPNLPPALALDRQAFDEILGSLREVIDRNMSMRYTTIMSPIHGPIKSHR